MRHTRAINLHISVLGPFQVSELILHILKYFVLFQAACQNAWKVGPVQNLLLRVIPVSVLVQARGGAPAQMMTAVF